MGFLGGDFIICKPMLQEILNLRKKNHHWNFILFYFFHNWPHVQGIFHTRSCYKCMFTLWPIAKVTLIVYKFSMFFWKCWKLKSFVYNLHYYERQLKDKHLDFVL
jgi:hypothetical protein